MNVVPIKALLGALIDREGAPPEQLERLGS